MAQTVVTQFYSAKKNTQNSKRSVKKLENEKISQALEKTETKKVAVKKPTRGKTANVKTNKAQRLLVPVPTCTSTHETEESLKVALKKNEKVEEPSDLSEISEAPRTPKRNLSSPDELTPSKKKPIIEEKDKNTQKADSKSNFMTIKKRPAARKKLVMAQKSELKNNETTPQNNFTEKDDATDSKPENLVDLIVESKSKILSSHRLEDLKKSLEKFQRGTSVVKQFQSSSFRITAVISPGESKPPEAATPTSKKPPIYQEVSYLATPESSDLILPLKYKFLCEVFRCMDVVVSILNNRKEKITFEKMKEGVQKMMGRNFTKSHLGQIMTVLPSAYHMHYEKQDAFIINKSKDAPDYQLIICPNLSENSEKSSSKEPTAFIHVTPQHLTERRAMFKVNILEEVKKHHRKFLIDLKFPLVSDKNILRWHPKFHLDSVPDIQVSALPEIPEMKPCTARDVLNRIKGKVKGRVEKALKEVSEVKTPPNDKEVGNLTKTVVNTKPNSALKGICTDLLEKIRAKESVKLMETMTRSVEDEKRAAMMEQIPKIVHILWHYFIAERRAAVPVDLAVEKVIHSCSSLATPDEVKEHLQLIKEVLPGWLSFIKIPKGDYILMDKTKDINIMLTNLK